MKAVVDARNISIGGGVTFVEEITPPLRGALAERDVGLEVFLGPASSLAERARRRIAVSTTDHVLHAGNRAVVALPGTRQVVVIQDRGLIDPRTGPVSARKKVRRLLARAALLVADAVVVPSDSMARLIRASGRDTPVHVIPHGRPSWEPPEDRRLGSELSLLYPAFMHSGSHKNLELLPRLLRAAGRDLGPTSLTLTLDANDNWKGTTLRDLFGDVSEMVRFTGAVPRSTMPDLYAHHDVLVFPSRVESFGLPLLEAMTTSMPIVTSDLDWAHELCGDAAAYADPDDPGPWVEALSAIRDRGHRSNPEGVARAASFDWDVSGRRLAAVLIGE